MGNAQSLTATNTNPTNAAPMDDNPSSSSGGVRYAQRNSGSRPSDDLPFDLQPRYPKKRVRPDWDQTSQSDTSDTSSLFEDCFEDGLLEKKGHEGSGQNSNDNQGHLRQLNPTMENTSRINSVLEAAAGSTSLPSPSRSGHSNLPKPPSYIHLQSPSAASLSDPSSPSFSSFSELRMPDVDKDTTEETKLGDDSQRTSSTTRGFDGSSSDDGGEDQEEGTKRDDDDDDVGSPTLAVNASSKTSIPISAIASNTLSNDETDDEDRDYSDHELSQHSTSSSCHTMDNSQSRSDVPSPDLVDLDDKTKNGDEGEEKDEDDVPKPTPNASFMTSTTFTSDSVIPSSIDYNDDDDEELERKGEAQLARLGKEHVTPENQKDSFGFGVEEPKGDSDFDDLKAELETLKITLTNEVLERERLKEEKAKVEARVENMLDLVEHYNLVVEESKKQVEEAERKADEAGRVVEETKKVLKGEVEKVLEVTKENETLKGRVRVLEEENEVLDARVRVLEGEVEGFKEEVEGQKGKVDDLRKQLGEEMEREEKLEEELEKANEMIKVYREREGEEERAMAHASSDRHSVLTVLNSGADIESLRTRLRAGRLGKE